MEPAVFLDRDNTLIANDGDLGDPDLVRLLDGVGSGIKALREAGYRLVVITNQGGVARGKYTEADVDAVHARVSALVDEASGGHRLIDRFYYCPYHPKGTVARYGKEHPWRKPSPGMLLQAAQDMGLDLARSWVIGDQPRDAQAGRSAGCRTILIGEATDEVKCTATVTTFSEAVQTVLRGSKSASRSGQSSKRRGRTKSRRTVGEASTTTLPETAIEAKPTPVASPAPDAVPKPTPEPAPADDANTSGLHGVRRSIVELAEEVRTDRLRRAEFTPLKMVGLGAQLLAVLTALLALLHIGDSASFMAWMSGAILLQLVTMTIILLDQRG